MSDIAPVRDEIRKIAPYNSGMTLKEVRARYSPAVLSKLGSNENPLGASQRALAALRGLNDLVHLYPDPQGQELCSAIACSFDTTPDHIVLGNGSEDLIGVICRAVVRSGDPVVTLYPSFPLHEDYTVLMGGDVERIAVKADLTIDLDNLIEAAGRKPRMIMLSNPMNPVGSWLTRSDFARLIEALDEETVVVVDEAYAEYAKGEDYPSAAHLLRQRMKNWVVLRTFSKAYGLAGLRIGYGVVGDPELCSYFNRARTPFNTNAAAQLAALAALGDVDHLARTTAHNTF
jgi:histidinol-phosphate aminotransferase